VTAAAAAAVPARGGETPADAELRAIARLPAGEALARLKTTAQGLAAPESAARLKTYGPNRVVSQARAPILVEIWRRARNPLNLLLVTLAAVSLALGDLRSAAVIFAMVALSVGLGFVQEHRSSQAAAKLSAMVRVRAAVLRPGAPQPEPEPIDDLAPGDVVRLAAGDMIPADVRILSSKDLYVNQSALTGESLPAEKHADAAEAPADDLVGAANLAFLGSNVTSGFAEAVVVRTGPRTAFGHLAGAVVGLAPQTSFDRGIASVARLMMMLILVMAPLVFLINGLTKGDWLQALFFALAVAVGLTPEMLPMIVTMNLSQGALDMAKKRVIVKRLNAIQNFGAMDVLCTDKTGTLTENRVVLKRHLDVEGHDDDAILVWAYLNARFQSGLRNIMDDAVLAHAELEDHLDAHAYRKLDEVPFDFQRRRLSVVVAGKDGKALLICKGAVEEVFACCTRYRLGDQEGPLDASHAATARDVAARLNADGFRVVAVASRTFDAPQAAYSAADETGLTLLGYIAFLDPPKASAGPAIAALAAAGVGVKILTGDNEIVCRKICRDVGAAFEPVCLGSDIAAMDDEALARRAPEVAIFAKLSPDQKARVITALQRAGHVVGFMGDGINDAPALKAADVGVSVDDAADIAKESADIILLERSLAVLQEGVLEGRRVFANIIKYIRMGASSNFGNMFSVLGASLFLPFLPMAPIQVLTNNMLYDVSQTAIPTDRVDAEYLLKPRKWDIGRLLRFVLVVGPISSIFDYATFALMLYVFHAWGRPHLFQTGWFVESLLTQTLIIHVIRTTRIPFLQSRASTALIVTSLAVCAVGVALPYTVFGAALGFEPLPAAYWPIITGFMVTYAVLAHLAKRWFVRRWGV
jgi:Mg2+-importing ATPase